MRVGKVKISKLFSVIDWCLKSSFPTDYDARCLYTACAIYSILKDEGIKSVIVGGNVGAFMLSNDGCQASLEGFRDSNQEQPSHYWVEVNGIILDPNISYLPKNSRIQRCPMPMIAWDCKNKLPKGLQYKDTVRYNEDVQFIFPDEFSERIFNFIEKCKKRYKSNVSKNKLSTWIAYSPESLFNEAKVGDKWAVGLLRFQSMKLTPTIY
ncbi:hypothetical protein HMPREF1170_02660 [Aeromonas veronii AMC35]|uniref:hypothetical protein n=1 Tax=Aeromonas veronii TaxID=654 RepID=UPI0002806D08|nr:hypothetical protein [Aeromonas veronii]EKB22398.1 hypothetical protein HMPREF1170_02660 [Aeromonas veronii AMC35]TNJ03921.1 hypothetical protein CF117_10025 [Aeromonas veronii]